MNPSQAHSGQFPPVTGIPGRLSDAGIAGPGSAGRALALRLAAAGLRVSLWDASAGAVEAFVTSYDSARGGLVGYADCEDFVESLNTPRRIVLFEPQTGLRSALPRALLEPADRVLEYPVYDEDIPCGDVAQLELTLVFQMA